MYNPFNQQEPDLGYVLYPPRRLSEPGYSRLDVLLCSKPTKKHFDPLRLGLRAVAPTCDLQYMYISRPWERGNEYHVVVGPVAIEGFNGNTHEFFTFGGDLEIDNSQDNSDCTLAKLTSPAPILARRKDRSPATMLMDEVEILLAQRRAQYDSEQQPYEDHLVNVDPIYLYYACLRAIQDRLKTMPRSESEAQNRFSQMIRDEMKAVSKMPLVHVEQIPALAELV